MAHCSDLGLEWLLNLSSFLNFCQNRYGTETSAENKQNSVKKIENQEKKMINQEKRPFRIRDKYIDRDSEYLLQENEPDVTLDQQLLEDLQKKKTDLRYIEMQVMGSKMGEIFTCHLSLSFFFFFSLSRAVPLGIWKFPGQESSWRCSGWLMPQPQQRQNLAVSVTYTTAHGNAGCLTPNLPNKVRDQTCIPMRSSWVPSLLSHSGTPLVISFDT